MRHYAASVGIPSGRSPPFFGIYTRRTGSAGPGPPWRCKNPARLARALEVSATSPSIPAVLRPALRCVTCRTLSSVFGLLRSNTGRPVTRCLLRQVLFLINIPRVP